MKDCVNVSVSLPYKLKQEIQELQKTDKRYGWTAIFSYGYKMLQRDAEQQLNQMDTKIEKLASKLAIYTSRSYQLEEDLKKIRAERG